MRDGVSDDAEPARTPDGRPLTRKFVKGSRGLTGPLGLTGAAEGQQVKASDGTPSLGGQVERAGPPEYPEILLRLHEPAPGLVHLFAMPMGGMIYLPMRVYLYGEQAAAAVAREEPLWQAWIQKLFPPGGETNPAG